MKRPLLAVLAAIAAVVGAAACGVPGSGDFQRINPNDVPAVLSESTTTTAPSTTRPLRTTPPTAVETTTSTSTTVAPTSSTTAVYDVQFYFVAGRQELTPITRQLASPAPGQVLSTLLDGVPEGTEYDGLITALPPPGLDWSVSVAGGRATVRLPPEFVNDASLDQPLAIAQIVLTLTNRPGIGQVRFVSVRDEPLSVPKGDGELTERGGDVVCEDYRNLAPNATCG